MKGDCQPVKLKTAKIADYYFIVIGGRDFFASEMSFSIASRGTLRPVACQEKFVSGIRVEYFSNFSQWGCPCSRH